MKIPDISVPVCNTTDCMRPTVGPGSRSALITTQLDMTESKRHGSFSRFSTAQGLNTALTKPIQTCRSVHTILQARNFGPRSQTLLSPAPPLKLSITHLTMLSHALRSRCEMDPQTVMQADTMLGNSTSKGWWVYAELLLLVSKQARMLDGIPIFLLPLGVQ